MTLNADTALAATPVSRPAGAWMEPFEDAVDALLQFDFDAVPEPPKKHSSRPEWKSPEQATSIKEALARWLDERL